MNDKDTSGFDGPIEFSMDDFEQEMEGSFDRCEVHAGDRVTGVIVDIGDEYAFLDIGAKSEGILKVEELRDEEGNLRYQTGDRMDVMVLSVEEEIHLSFEMRKRDQTREILLDAYTNRVPVQGRVVETNKGGFVVDLGGSRAFCPVSQMDIRYVEDSGLFVGETFHFLITRFDSAGRNIAVNRAQLLREEAELKAAELREQMRPGLVLPGIVRRVTDFGAFIDIGGMDGLVHISELSWDRIEHPSEVVSEGQSVDVKILRIEQEGKRIALSLREVAGNPWEMLVGSEIVEGGIYEGTIMRLEPFGAFVRLQPGIEGLLHISEMTWGRSIQHPRDIVAVGETVRVQVLRIEQERRRIALGMKQLTGNPWDDAAEELTTDTVLSAEVSGIKRAGIEVVVKDGLRGFIPASMSAVARGDNLARVFETGSTITVRVVEFDPTERRLILAVVDPQKGDERVNYESYLNEQQKADSASQDQPRPGSFGDMLSRALKKNEDQQT